MKTDIHPTYYQATITCAGCGTTFMAGSTIEGAKVDICSNCHPFYTGQKRLIDTEGRVEKFERRQQQRKVDRRPQKVQAQPNYAKSSAASPSSQPASESPRADRPKSLREMLQEAANSK